MIRTALVLLLIFAGLGAALVDGFAGLLLYLWFAFFRPQEWVWTDITSLRLSLVIAVTFVARSFAGGKFPNATHPLSWALITLVLATTVAELVTPVARSNWDWLIQVAQTALIVLLLVTHVDTPRRLRLVALVLTCSIGFHTARHGLTTVLSPSTRVVQGVAGAFSDNNSYAVICAMVAVLLVAVGGTLGSRLVRMGFYAAGALSGLTVIATFSRGGFLAIASATVVYALVRRVGLGWILGAACLGGLLFTFVPLPEGYTDRLETIQTYKEDESASSRLHFWTVALDMSADQPLGVGIQNFNSVFDRYDFSHGRYGSSRSVHNSHLQVLTEAGVFGFVAWVFALLYSVWVGFRVRRRARKDTSPDGVLLLALADGIIAAFIAFIVGGTFTAIAWNDFVWCLIGLTAALDRVTLASSQGAILRTPPQAVSYDTAAVRKRWGPRAGGVDPGLRKRVS